MVVNVRFVDMGCDDKGVVAFGETKPQFIPDFVRKFRRYFPRFKALAYLVGDNVASLFAPRYIVVLTFGKQELGGGCSAVALIRCDKFTAVCFVGICGVVGAINKAVGYAFAFVVVH